MNAQSPPSPPVSIGRVSIGGVSATTARAMKPAIEKALAAAAAEGRIAAGHRTRLKIELPHGASERDIAAALVRALERR
jgi:hypothetical protein